jgi:hypothetical protein
MVLLGAAALSLGAATATGCFANPEDTSDDEFGDTESHVEVTDPLEGAYVKQGGTPVFFVFKKGDTAAKNTFFGEIDVDGGAGRASGKIAVGRDNLGTTMTLTQTGTKTKAAPSANDDPDASPLDLQQADTRSLVDQAFSGTVHFIKIGKNDTILVRGDTNGKTAQYKKVKTWCSTDDDCSSDVQNTGLDCSNPTCSKKSTCVCNQ